MVPIFGRYLLRHYLNVLVLVVGSFIALLLVSRLEEIAAFASMGAPIPYLARFILYQIPYILPIALPISCLISSMLLFQRLSHTRELTALRAAGLSLRSITAPVLIAAALLSWGNFYIASELATTAHLATREMTHAWISVNPLVLLQNAQIAKLKGAYVQMHPVRSGEVAKNLVIALYNKTHGTLGVLLADKVTVEKEMLLAENIHEILALPNPGHPDAFEHLLIENQQTLSTAAPACARLLRQKGWKMANDHLSLALLHTRIQHVRQEMHRAHTPEAARGNIQTLNKCYTEGIRRLSLGLAVFTFTLLGIAFGMDIGRHNSKKGVLWVFALATLSFASFFVGKALDIHLGWAAFFYLAPHGLIFLASGWTLRKVYRGIE